MKSLLESKEGTMCIVDAEDFANEIIRHTLDSGGRLVSLTPRKQTLEEYFISQLENNNS